MKTKHCTEACKCKPERSSDQDRQLNHLNTKTETSLE